jgi:hypothetical protein
VSPLLCPPWLSPNGTYSNSEFTLPRSGRVGRSSGRGGSMQWKTYSPQRPLLRPTLPRESNLSVIRLAPAAETEQRQETRDA